MSKVIESKDEAINRVEANANAEWRVAAYKACCLCAQQWIELSTDDVWELMESLFPDCRTHEPRAMGAIMRQAARAGKIEASGEYFKSRRPQCHGRPVAIWDSLTFDHDAMMTELSRMSSIKKEIPA